MINKSKIREKEKIDRVSYLIKYTSKTNTFHFILK